METHGWHTRTAKRSIKMPPIQIMYWNSIRLTTFLQVVEVLEQSHEIRIRWSAEWNYDAVTPFSSRVPSGFHVFYTPGENVSGYVCQILSLIPY
jgi:hypothetical protein